MTEEDIFDVVRRKTTEVLPDIEPAEVSIDGSLSDLGANSIDRAEIVTLTMEELGVVIPVSDFSGVADVRSLVVLLGKYA